MTGNIREAVDVALVVEDGVVDGSETVGEVEDPALPSREVSWIMKSIGEEKPVAWARGVVKIVEMTGEENAITAEAGETTEMEERKSELTGVLTLLQFIRHP